MTYPKLREEIRELAGWGFTREDAIQEYTQDIMTAIDTYLEEKAANVEKDIFQQEQGKIFSKIAAKCLEAPFPEIAIDHAFKRFRERAAAIIRNKEI